ncbi:sulfite exporter TauE/SafE family protein [Mycobacterium sp. CVI_P3]|uniref:Probable membrane transporter protein n=1 Tax=Mycobacterium pinniadriaticum TaxID=2994102 RepID=A0ABT3S7M4_9MYCO|nr:sulfite exporter TauE/SafE family protein [Mycobacterium pinniadriaticum]MCX2929067.1 sulfite exporter TauE/SafE family protein [Mycobacterium pinniadriaticum]MCX2935492.1 sulfite exporter TauE/SafE family protein [Mycobacterium pinniadriaticum]
MIALTVVLAVLVGVSLGLLGGGGSILTVPLLAYVAGMDAKQAIATSLLVVGVTSAVGAVSHARAGRVQWRTALLFGATAMVGAYAGGHLAKFIPGSVLLIGFALMMIATAVAMLRGRKSTTESAHPKEHLPILKIVAEGVVVGLVTGLVGAGGGFLVVPALVLLGGLPMPVAVGTSLVVIAMKSFAGLAGYLSVVQIDWTVAAMVTAAAVLGGILGSRFAAVVNPDALRKAFGWFVLIMSGVILGQEVHAAVGITVVILTGIGAAIMFGCSRIQTCPLRRSRAQTAARTSAA